MKKAILALAIAILMIPTPMTASAGEEEHTDIIVELLPPDDCESYEYALECAKLAARYVTDCEYDSIYDTLLCGFSARLPESQISLLESLDFVENIYYCESYLPLSASVTDSDTAILAAEMAGIGAARQAKLTGDGVKVAVIDSGFDVTHPAFDTTVTDNVDLESFNGKMALHKLSMYQDIDNISKLRYNSKIPFMYDYTEQDSDVSTTFDHGTHVAGIIGAAKTDSSTMVGIAPDCQLLLMKVFKDDGTGALDSVLISALEDALKLGADVINLSIGHYAGSSQADRVIGLNNIIERIEKSGCIVVCASGNDSVSTAEGALKKGGGPGLPLANYTDYGTVSTPATCDSALAVAAVNNAVYYGDYIKHARNENLYFEYTDTNVASEVTKVPFREYFGNKTIEYAVIPGIGDENDYSGIDVDGKLALIARGTITFAQKANIAAAHGAVGAIIYNNIPDEYINMELSGAHIPAISVSLDTGTALIAEEYRFITVDSKSISKPHPGKSGLISEYSSMGATPSLRLKPDISAVGGSVYSTVVGGGYGGISGTSMAAPQIAGMCALLYENARNEGSYDSSTITDTVRKILLNTAIPVHSENGVEYSPRAQGAGLINIESALGRQLELTYANNSLPKAELFDGYSDVLNFEVNVRNLTDSELTVNLGATLTSDGYTEITFNDKTEYYSTLEAVADSVSIITSGESGNLNRYSEGYTPLTLTLAASETRTLPITISLDKDYHGKLSEIFSNGHFIEGFVYCITDKSEISMPYLGYYGDFSAAPLIDGDIYKNETAMFRGTHLYVPIDTAHITAGANIFTEPYTYDAATVSFSPNGDGKADEILFGTSYLRNFISATMTVTDKDGNVITTSRQSYGVKTTGVDEPMQFAFYWNGGDGIYANYKMPDGKYTMTLDYILDDEKDTKQTYSYEITLDNTPPILESVSLENSTLTISADDSNGIFAVRIYENDSENAFSMTVTDKTAVFDISEYNGEKLYYEIVDYAFNTTVGILRIPELAA